MLTYEFGDRVGRTAAVRLGVTAAILDPSGRLLLTRRADNGEWCMPGGAVDPGESLAEACAREVREEIGVEARITRLLGTYSSPDIVAAYPDGNRAQIVAAVFRAEIVSGAPAVSDEVTEVGWFARDQVATLAVIATQRHCIADVFTDPAAPFFD
jgi:8-oxo-dGTP pyrophosphatase MutT (NUDIX family)